MNTQEIKGWYKPLLEEIGDMAKQINAPIHKVVQAICMDWFARIAAARGVYGSVPAYLMPFMTTADDTDLETGSALFEALTERYVTFFMELSGEPGRN